MNVVEVERVFVGFLGFWPLFLCVYVEQKKIFLKKPPYSLIAEKQPSCMEKFVELRTVFIDCMQKEKKQTSILDFFKTV